MNNAEVHQFHSGTALGDAITNEMLAWRSHLRTIGYTSEIYAEHIPEELSNDIRAAREYQPNGSLLLIHHSMGHDLLDWLLQRAANVLTVYHNITPPKLLSNAHQRRYARLGHTQLGVLAARSRSAIADSNYNRRHLLRAGFERVHVIPVRTDYSAFSPSLLPPPRSTDWLFVGRVVPSKGQIDLIRAFARFAAEWPESRLLLVGDASYHPYVDRLSREAETLAISSRVEVVGKVDDAELAELYARAGAYVSLSEHEGFGVPLLEAMAAELPVVAYASSAVPETLGGAGVLLESKSPEIVVEAVRSILASGPLRDRAIERQRERVAAIAAFDTRKALRTAVDDALGTWPPTSVQIQGPFETSYSLATLNRELARSLDQRADLDLSLYATEGPGDYVPDPANLLSHPEASLLHDRSAAVPYPDIVIRQMHPPRVNDSPGGLTFQYFGWEESRIPQSYVDDFNQHLDGIGAMSTFVAEVLRSSGVTVPIEVVGVGVRKPTPPSPPRASSSGSSPFRFLHISSAFPRKGVDLLLRAYFAKFEASDNVTLTLKTFPNPHNDVGELLRDLRNAHERPPDVQWIDQDMDDGQIDQLYASASALVHPCRGEGFGLPVAEAMLAGVPVIAPASTGLADFVSDETAFTVPFSMVEARTHLSIPGSEWAEPDLPALGEQMRWLFENLDDAEVARKVSAARSLIESTYTWTAVADRWATFMARTRRRMKAPRVAMVTTWNSRCGIAEYSGALVSEAAERWDVEIYANDNATPLMVDQEDAVFRVWEESPHAPITSLQEHLGLSRAEVVHIQYNFGFMGLSQLAELIRAEHARRPVVLTLHRTNDLIRPGLTARLIDIVPALELVDCIVVHQDADAARLQAFGLSNVTVLPIGTRTLVVRSAQAVRSSLRLEIDVPVIGTFGFLLPHKGILELIRAIDVLTKSGTPVGLIGLCAVHPDPSSAAYLQVCRDEIQALGLTAAVRLVTEFLPSEIADVLLASADMIVLPYHETSESSSASLRSVLPLGRPILASDLAIFADARDILVLFDAPPTPDSIATALQKVMNDPTAAAHLALQVQTFAKRSTLSRTVALHTDVYLGVIAKRKSSHQGQVRPPLTATGNLPVHGRA